MPLNISKGNMFPFVSHTWNTVKGKCPHDCSYCYMKQFQQNDMRFDKKELNTDLGKDNFIFVGSSCDMWADEVSEEWILETLRHCDLFFNKYLFQSKNPHRIVKFEGFLPDDSVIGTTIETNRVYPEMGNTPAPRDRAAAIQYLSNTHSTMVTVEPIMDFDLEDVVDIIKFCDPEWVSIGADSKEHGLPEPTAMKILSLIDRLEKDDIEVKQKDNLKRLMQEL